ncbi:MAG TPA: hypothetical protein VGF06_08940 [Terriglobales bacterium]|jgi:hypothetical protein
MSTSQPESPKAPAANRPAVTAAKTQAKADQSDRLAVALRDNLKRRKAQARARKDSGTGGHEG